MFNQRNYKKIKKKYHENLERHCVEAKFAPFKLKDGCFGDNFWRYRIVLILLFIRNIPIALNSKHWDVSWKPCIFIHRNSQPVIQRNTDTKVLQMLAQHRTHKVRANYAKENYLTYRLANLFYHCNYCVIQFFLKKKSYCPQFSSFDWFARENAHLHNHSHFEFTSFNLV